MGSARAEGQADCASLAAGPGGGEGISNELLLVLVENRDLSSPNSEGDAKAV